jgi:hypothetical protein
VVDFVTTTQVNVHLSPELARELREGRSDSTEARELLDMARELNVKLLPMHPSSTDVSLASTFMVQAKDRDHATEVVKRFQERGVNAYLKPAPSPP